MSTWNQLRTAPGLAIVQDTGPDGASTWRLFTGPREVHSAAHPKDVAALMRRVEDAAEEGLFAVGYVAYEAGPAFEPALPTRGTGALPLAWFGLYDNATTLPAITESCAVPAVLWKASLGPADYAASVERIKAYIAAGDTYQVNHCLRLDGLFDGDALGWFRNLCLSQRAGYGAYIDTGRHRILSASPELFFRRDGDRIVCRPMKGTARRGMTWDDDQRRAESLQHSVKNRAENVMIVDMVRNDLGRIAETGSVTVERLFDIERYPTVLQLTSTVHATTSASLLEIFQALFPCASITGAPKVRTSQIIHELEPHPRGVYTGAIGFIGPGPTMQFNVAIRTVCVDVPTGKASYGTGSGVVWDSDAGQEYEECLAKALVLEADPRPFQLIETLLWRPESGYYLLEQHLARLSRSARYFGFPLNLDAVKASLFGCVMGFKPVRHRVRLALDDQGGTRVESTPTGPMNRQCRAVLDDRPIASDDRFLYHKTTRRDVYDAARARHPGADDVLLWNERGEITESTVSNVVVRMNHVLYAPPVASGLLAGTLRAQLLARKRIHERVILKEDLAHADAVYLINSVRGWRRVVFVENLKPET